MNIAAWIEATRPKTLAASIIPVIVANSLAYSNNTFNLKIALITLICAILIQITSNFYNEVYDFWRGADNEDRLGPKRQVASGVISAKAMLITTICLSFLTFALGLILVSYSGIYVLLIGLLSLIFAWAYTGGPYPLAYKGLGDVFVFIFFGLIAVNGAFYVQTQELNFAVLVASIAPGLLSANILSVNNIRDIETDIKANKITLAVRLGKINAIRLYIFANIFAYLSIVYLSILMDNLLMLMPLITIALAFKITKSLYSSSGKEMNKLLALTGLQLMLTGVITALVLIFTK